jgi:hypothetical protein
MLNRYIDGLKKAASRAGEFHSNAMANRPKLFVDFIEGLKGAAGSAHQLSHSRMDTRWLDIRDFLEKILDLGKTMPPTNESDARMWAMIQQNLNGMVDKGQKLANSAKGQTRLDTLVNLSIRENKTRSENDRTS